jgi:type I restriction-modification system DNA methylase subunit
MLIAPEIIHDHLTELPRRRSLDAALELFDALGYQYADELPLPTRDWPTGVQSLVNHNAAPPIYLARHRDFHVVYTHLTTDELYRTVERPIVEHTLHKLHPYALFVFANHDLTLWDFVNVKYVAEACPERRRRNGARRRTMRRIHVGPTERLHTAAQRIALLAVPAPDASALELQSLHDRAFDVEEVTHQFYQGYVGVFKELCDDIAQRNPHCQAEIEAQVLLDRLLFLYFIQKKGWLDSQLDYLYQHFQAHYRDDPTGTSFYDDFLFPLFVALSNEDAAFPSLGDVPFLNGGLFEVPADVPLADQLAVSNNAFRHAFDDLLERYNFTVREDTPLDVEVAIDPEMLGQIFENLVLGLERGEDRRKATGSYYTPRVIVHFMCRQALKEYLAAESGLHPVGLEALMDVGPAEQLTPEEVAALNEMITEPEARLLQGLVEGARVLDPAVGSGAFLVGMLYEMVALTRLLDVRLYGQGRVQRRNYDYDLKRSFIERALYGVDIQSEAVRICELRLWLSLMVDYQREAGEAVPTLPNLSYRVRVGDSLIERLFGEPVQLDQLADDAVARQLIDRIQTEKQAYFKEPDLWEKQRRELRILGLLCELAAKLVGAKRGAVLTQMSVQVPSMGDEFLSREHRKLKEAFEVELARYAGLLEEVKSVYDQVRAMQTGEVPIEARDVDALRTQLGLSFLWRLDFAEVFADQGGFDVVIANPPYIRQERFSEQKPLLRAAFPDVYHGVADLYVYFYRRGLALIRPKGVLTFISSNKFFRAGYGEALRTYLRDNTRLKTVIDFGDLPIFEATTYPCVLVASNRRPGDGEARAQALNVRSMATLEYLADAVQRDGWPQPQQSLHPDGWALERPEVLALLEKLRRSGTPLGEYIGGRFYRGVTTGLNEAFVIDQATRDRLIAEDPRSAEIIKPWIRGRDIDRWRVDWPGLYLLWTYQGIEIKEYQAIREYLSRFREKLTKRWEPSRGQCEWYELRPCDFYAEFEKPKIVYPDIAKEPEFAYDTTGAYGGNTMYILPTDELYLLGILNSSAVEFFYTQISSTIRGDYLRFIATYMEQVPIPDATPAQRAAIEALVRKLLDAKGQGPQVAEWEWELNALVYEVYELTEGEIGVVEGLDHE